MRIAATPMCKQVLNLAGVLEFDIIKDDKDTKADIIFTLSETKIPSASSTKYVKLKLNTYKQIEASVKLVSEILNTKPINQNLNLSPKYHHKEDYRNLRLKVHTNFIREIIEDLEFQIVEEDYDYMVYPDYLRTELEEEIKELGKRAIELPSHKNAPKNPIKRVELRYKILENSICI
jgi:segregation and condensation protein B